MINLRIPRGWAALQRSADAPKSNLREPNQSLERPLLFCHNLAVHLRRGSEFAFIHSHLDTGADLTITAEASGLAIDTLTDIGTSAVQWAPRQATSGVTGAASLHPQTGVDIAAAATLETAGPADITLIDSPDKLHLLANTLLERETIDGDQMDRVLRGETLGPILRSTDSD